MVAQIDNDSKLIQDAILNYSDDDGDEEGLTKIMKNVLEDEDEGSEEAPALHEAEPPGEALLLSQRWESTTNAQDKQKQQTILKNCQITIFKWAEQSSFAKQHQELQGCTEVKAV